MSKANRFSLDKEGALSPGAVIGLVVAVLVAAAAIPTAVSAIANTNTTGWGVGEIALWGIVGIVVIAVVVVALTKGVSSGKGGA